MNQRDIADSKKVGVSRSTLLWAGLDGIHAPIFAPTSYVRSVLHRLGTGGRGTGGHERLNTGMCPALNFDLVYIVHGQSYYTTVNLLCLYLPKLYRECVGITSPRQGDWYCGGCSQTDQ